MPKEAVGLPNLAAMNKAKENNEKLEGKNKLAD
jgi:hypothetical protein